ncbi:uncharacterized protein LOC112526934 [Cynara cardunculus var. scolymus]|uniref:Uncharacterized protein n=1 Tax=Cynara cardunculus var. scolymus TaxID=59895 RepID=A0A118JSV1_CYNCS|nr:uncharacterized protein LOC112526934 [Cynara cardunculus var. scolymus]KVH89107.1 hypothetical protein Ccrd_008908 [Cynara cardunculus var. scolymus]
MEMEEQHQPEEQALDQVSDEVQELETLEEDVKLMAKKIAEFRETLPTQLQNTLASVLSAQRPVNLNQFDNDPGTSSNPNPESEALVEHDPIYTEKIQMIKQKIYNNASAMPSLLKRMKDCISRIDKLDSFNSGIHPAFKRRKITSEDSFI